MVRPTGVITRQLSRLQRERVRNLAHDAGMGPADIAQTTGFTIHQIKTALRAKSASIGTRTRRPRLLTPEQEEELVTFITSSAINRQMTYLHLSLVLFASAFGVTSTRLDWPGQSTTNTGPWINGTKSYGLMRHGQLVGTTIVYGLPNAQDNAPAHAAAATRQDLEERKVQVIQWPAFSPDLNPIETVWNYMKDYIEDHHSARKNPSHSVLRRYVQEAWEVVPEAYLQDLVNTMPARCQAVIAANGYHVKF
ncbi:hypothetical protein H072_1671 [Dactylellina haptotyla CBS 200.50]|uniref:Tc1-like transposase DDE domain-containing protein n=1 Tax=Dactylellina haptotyla (strain CBS 200.50) TaxID=1284197 RepID=S8AN46_DACHA|nr:hypothetical protein H072_1671 [Dactylellina haptotyla CBS 200.50]